MPSGTPALRRRSSSTPGAAWASSVPGPPPPAPLLRADGGDGPAAAGRRIPPISLARAARELRADAVRILGAADADPVSPRWRTPTFAVLVEAARRQLAVLDDAGLLAIAFAHEALHARPIDRIPAVWVSPVRVAYAVRWVELETDLALPPWPSWFR